MQNFQHGHNHLLMTNHDEIRQKGSGMNGVKIRAWRDGRCAVPFLDGENKWALTAHRPPTIDNPSPAYLNAIPH